MVTLVTGGTGFVGANIVRDLARNGHQVVSFDINGPDQLFLNFLDDDFSAVTFVQGDIVDRPSVERCTWGRSAWRKLQGGLDS